MSATTSMLMLEVEVEVEVDGGDCEGDDALKHLLYDA
jgi:hypothetical protein